MTDDLSLDPAVVDAQLEPVPAVAAEAGARGAWLARRSLGVGCSEVPVALALAGLRPLTALPRYLADRARTVRVPGGTAPRIVAEKAGLLAPRAVGEAARRGIAREAEVLAAWQAALRRGAYYDPREAELDAESVRHASDAPGEWYPLVDRHAPVLVDTPDGWARDCWGSLVAVQIKASVREATELREHWRDQLQAEIAVTGATWGVLICGEGWARTWSGGVDGPVRCWPLERDEAEHARIRGAVRALWSEVEDLRRRIAP